VVAGCSRNKPDSGPAARGSAKTPAVKGAATVPPKKEFVKLVFEKPKHVRGIYLTAWSAGSKKKMANMFAMMKRTELNSVVIDIRDDGIMYWKTGIPLAKESGAERVAVVKPERVMASLKEAGVYPIARIACFRDAFVPFKQGGEAPAVG